MSLIALTAAVLLASQTFAPAPRYAEADVARLEGCVFDGDDMARCGDFSEDVQALETCAQAEFVLASTTEEERLLALESAWGEIAAAFGLPQPARETLVRQIRGF